MGGSENRSRGIKSPSGIGAKALSLKKPSKAEKVVAEYWRKVCLRFNPVGGNLFTIPVLL